LNRIIELKLASEIPFRYNSNLLAGVLQVMRAALKANTSKGYRTGLSSYICFAQRQGIPIAEAWPATDLLLAAWALRVCSTITYQSFKMYFQGLKYYHVKARMSVEGFESKWISSYLMGLRKSVRNQSQKQKRWPITIPQLHRILSSLNPKKPKDALKGLIYVVGFHGGPRPSEYLKKYIGTDLTNDAEGLVHPIIQWRDVSTSGVVPKRRISIRVHGAKHDPDDKGYVMRFQENETMSCVVGWMDHHKSHRIKNTTFDDFFPLFALRTVPVTVELAKSWLKADAQASGLIGHNYTAYSLRRGLATTLFLVGASPNTIKRFGRWRSDSYKDYIELDPATTAIWSTRLLRTQLQNFGPLSLEEAAQLTLSSVDEFFTKYRHKRTC
jgi:hypothetical protein